MIQPFVDTPWFGLHVRSNFEKVAATILNAKGIEVYLPTFRCRRRWSDRVKEVDQPLFPGYVFCRFDALDRLPILTTPGVLSIVGVAKTPAPIPEAEIFAVRRIADSALTVSPWPFLHAGQRVVIERGAMAGAEGILLNFKGRYRIVVSISLLQRSVAAEIDIEMVRAVRSAPPRLGLNTLNHAQAT